VAKKEKPCVLKKKEINLNDLFEYD
jgi:hypothetical protein